MRGVGNKTRKRILAAVKVLRERLGSTSRTAKQVPLPPMTYTPTTAASPRNGLVSTYWPAAHLEGESQESKCYRNNGRRSCLLGLDQRVDLIWPSQNDIAPLAGVTRGRISQILADAQQRWVKDPAITALRDQIAALLDGSGGVMSADELCESLTAARGSIEDEPRRGRLAACCHPGGR